MSSMHSRAHRRRLMRIAFSVLAGLAALVLDACDPPCAAIAHAHHNGTTACGNCVLQRCSTELAADLNASQCTAENECFNACIDVDGGLSDPSRGCGCESACITTPACRSLAESLWSCELGQCGADCR